MLAPFLYAGLDLAAGSTLCEPMNDMTVEVLPGEGVGEVGDSTKESSVEVDHFGWELLRRFPARHWAITIHR